FEECYQKLYGHLVPRARPQVLTWRLTGRSSIVRQQFELGEDRPTKEVQVQQREIYLPLQARFGTVPVYERYALVPGTLLEGPLVLEERESTLVVPVSAEIEIRQDRTVSITLKEF